MFFSLSFTASITSCIAQALCVLWVGALEIGINGSHMLSTYFTTVFTPHTHTPENPGSSALQLAESA